MSLLAIDIGGTNSRFLSIEDHSCKISSDLPCLKIPTQSDEVHNFEDLLKLYESSKPDSFLNVDQYDILAFSVPGPVYNTICQPPNIPWQINVDKLNNHHTVFMINDFAAQAYACMLPEIQQQLMIIRKGNSTPGNRIAIVGAGTGIGHCTLQNNEVIPSEAGHATFSFIGELETAFEQFLKTTLKIDYCVNDNIINGRGIILLHEFLTGSRLSAEEIFSEQESHKKTIGMFSQFYARAARNFCLTNCIDNTLIISGGLAAKNPELVTSGYFLEEFDHLTNEAYRTLLNNISIVLNRKDEIGVYGVALYALKHMAN